MTTAQELLATIPPGERERIEQRAAKIALAHGRGVIWLQDVISAVVCAGDEFLPEPGEYVDEETES